MRDDDAVRHWVASTFARLRSEDYARTAVLSQRVVAHTAHGGTVDVLWARVRRDDSEIERLACTSQWCERRRACARWRSKRMPRAVAI